MKRQKVGMATLSIILVMGLTSCSYKNFEDSLKNWNQEVSESTEKNYINPASISDNKEKENGDTERKNESNVFRQKETVTITSWNGGQIQYTLNKVEVVQNIHDLNLSLEDFNFPEKPPIGESGKIMDSDGEKNYFVAAYVTVKNCSVEINDAETEYPLIIDPCSGSQSNILTSDGPFLNYAVYFSAHPQDKEIMDKKYYFFKLEPDSEMEVVIGWIVSESMLAEPYYYVMNAVGNPEEYQYFLLNESQEEKP